ncbi:WD40 domain-containing protein [Lacipirellula limnantheis]|nr:protein kinase [Lacipirellula limnantheis]
MSACPNCQHPMDEAASKAGRCPSCGAVVRQLPRRNIAEPNDLENDAERVRPSKAPTDAGPEATIADFKAVEPSSAAQGKWFLSEQPETPAVTSLSSNEMTIELPPTGSSSSETVVSLELIDTSQVELSDDQPDVVPKTVAFNAEQTVQFLGGSSAVDDSMLTSHWEGAIDGKAADPNVTIKQKETITGSFVTSSSLIVKSRTVRPPGASSMVTTSPADAPDYELLNVIGEGGMGVVYAARQSSIARTVALKMLKGDDSKNAAQREKFISEAVVTGELDHPNIVPIYDLGANNDGALFYSMKRVKGTPWNKVIKERSLDENLTILLRAADAVAFAHVNGVIHRDLKPENIMLGDFGEVLVMDWGLARVSPDFPNAASVSQSDAMGGTPAYMAPEMATGPIDKITTASDVYLLGAILFEIITGRPPHSGKTVMACLFSAAKNQIVETKKSGELVEIAMKAMATDMAERHASVPEFQRAVREYQSHSQSIQLVEHAQRNLQLAEERQDYELYARATYGLEEALALWDGNHRASSLLDSARVDYAKLALAKGDFDLGVSLLDQQRESHRETLAELQRGLAERESRKRRIKLLKGAVAALVASVIGIVSIAFVAVRSQRDEAVSQRNRAVTAEAEATKNFQEAEVARGRAEVEAERAREAEGRAESNLADALRERNRAEKAKTAEEYAAYVARIGLTKAKIEEGSFDRAAELLAQCPPDLRGWEWGRLDFLCNLADRSWKNAAPIDAAAFAPDGVHAATGDWDGKAIIWNLQTGKPEREFPQGEYVHAVAYDQAGQRLAAGGSDGSVHIYRVDTGELLAKLQGHEDAVLSVRFSPDDRYLLTSGYDQTARLWDLATGQQLQALKGHSWWVWSAEFSPDGQQIVTTGQDGKAIVWRRATPHSPTDGGSAPAAVAASSAPFEKLTEFTGHRGPVYAARFSPAGDQVATAGYDGRVLLWRPNEAQGVDIARRLDGIPDPPAQQTELLAHRGPVRTLAFAPDGKTLASGGQDDVVVVWNLETGKPLKQLRGHASHVRSVAYSPDGQLLLSGGRDAQIKLWRPATYAEQRELAAGDEDSRDAILSARFSPDGQQIVTAGRDRTASVWNANSLERLEHLAEGHDFLASSAIFFGDGSRLATGAGDGTVRLWDVATGAETRRLDDTGRTAALDVSDNAELIATGGDAGTAIVWDANSGDRVATLAGHDAEVTALAFAPGGKLLATGDDRGDCRLWRFDPALNEWQAGEWLRGHSRTITAMTFADDGARLITSSGDNTCGQWDVAAAQEIRAGVLKHPEWVTDVAVSQDGRVALTSCDDGKLRLWSLADAKLLRTMASPSKSAATTAMPETETAFTSIDMSRDGQLAITACAADGTVRLWNLADGEELVAADGGPWLNLGDRGGLVWAARFAPHDRGVLVIGGNDARIFSLDSRALEVRFSPHGVVASADLSPDGKHVATGSWDRSAKIWDRATGKVLVKLDAIHNGFINSVRYSPDGSKLITASDDGTARLWNAADGARLEPVFGDGKSRLRDATFSPDGKRVVTAANDKTAKVYDAASGNLLLTLAGHEWAVRSADFSADGRWVITGSDDNTAIVWDAASGQRQQTLAGHTGAITSVALSADGRRAITGSEDNGVKLWDAATGKELLTLAGHGEEVTAVSFSPDGSQILTSGRDGRALLWPTLPWTAAE